MVSLKMSVVGFEGLWSESCRLKPTQLILVKNFISSSKIKDLPEKF